MHRIFVNGLRLTSRFMTILSSCIDWFDLHHEFILRFSNRRAIMERLINCQGIRMR